MTIIRLGILAWVAGLVAYLGALGLFYGEWISRGDLGAVVVTSAVAFAVCYLVVYLPLLRAARRLLPRSAWMVAFPMIAVMVGIVPTALIARVQGGSFRALLTPEAGLFCVLFVVVGIVVGVGFALVDRGAIVT